MHRVLFVVSGFCAAGKAMAQRSTRPEPEPFIRLSTSLTLTRLKSPPMVCLRQLAATANSSAVFSSS